MIGEALQAAGHGHPIHLGHNIAGKKRHEIKIQHFVHVIRDIRRPVAGRVYLGIPAGADTARDTRRGQSSLSISTFRLPSKTGYTK